MGIEEFARLVAVVLLYSNGSVVSWLRSKEHNEEVGGHKDSLHLVALAVDVKFDSEDDAEAGIRMARRLGLLVIVEDGYVHVQVRH